MCDKTASICLIDDDPLMVRLFSKVITRAGFQVVSAISEKEALSVLERSAVDLVISDIQMPDISDGERMIELISQHHPNIPVCLMSADCSESVRQRLSALEIAGFLSKPFNAEQVKLFVSSLSSKS